MNKGELESEVKRGEGGRKGERGSAEVRKKKERRKEASEGGRDDEG